MATAPPALSYGPQVSMGLSKGELPRRNDGNSSSGSNVHPAVELQNPSTRLPRRKDETLVENSEMDTRQDGKKSSPAIASVTLIRKRKPIDFTMADLEAEESDDNDEFYANVEIPKMRKLPKRNCTIHPPSSANDSNEINSSFDDYIDDLVETTIVNINAESQMVAKSVIMSLITKVIGPRRFKRKVFVGKKSRRALKSSKYRKFHETDDQYQSRLKKSSALKQDNLKNEGRSVRKRRLYKLQQTRYV